ncbi:MAG TPA: hypothetical protein VNC60_02415 [Actinomycetota bacterium]|nr:hypothetical protein [Actinomycetota bacterium]
MRSTALLCAIVATVSAACSADDASPYEPLHQSARQEIPGTFGYVLVPLEGFRGEVDPSSAWRDLPGAGEGSAVSVTLADLEHPGEGVDWGPSWVYFTNDLCYFTAKGDFVSPSRAGKTDGCTRQNVLVQVVDATSGEFTAVFEAYDAHLTWTPTRVGTPDQVAGATRFQ